MAPPAVRTAWGTEAQHQEALVEWAQTQPWWPMFVHWPNERWNKAERLVLARQGVKPGPLDNWLFLPIGQHVGAVSELKRPGAPPSATTDDQKAWAAILTNCQFKVGVHYGVDEAMDFFRTYARGGFE